MGRGKRYDGEVKLNIKKVFAVVIAIVVVIMFVLVLRTLLFKQTGQKIINEEYFTAFESNKYGVINSKGDKIIEPSYAEYIVIPNNKKDLFICTYDVNYETETYKTKALNIKNEEVFKDRNYEQIEALDNYDSDRNISYEQNALRVKKDGKYGLIDLDGKEILGCEYDKIETLKGVQNSILIQKDGKMGLADSNGKIVVQPAYSDIKELGDDYKLGYIVVGENKKQGVIDSTNKTILEANYEEIKPISQDNRYVVKEGGKWKVINKDGTIVVENKFDDVKAISGNYILINKANKFGVITTEGQEVIKPQYEDISFAFTDTFIVKSKGKYGLVKANKEEALKAEYFSLTYQNQAGFLIASRDGISSEIIASDLTVKLTGIVSEINIEKGYLRIRDNEDYKYYNFKFEERKNTEILGSNSLFLSKKDGKYGFVDKNGKIVVDYLYDDATEQNHYEYAAINKDGKWGAIDKNGKVVVEPSHELTNNLKVDFIGQWHLGEDLNMNYYTK